MTGALYRFMPFAAALCLCSAVAAADMPTKSPASPFARPLLLRGTLGDAQIQVTLRAKADIEDGIEGDYFVFGSSQKVLLAGEVEGSDMFLEESENGTDVSGQWNGSFSSDTIKGDTISGDWLSADGSVTKPFMLKAMRAAAQPEQAKQPRSAARNNQ
jgi:hypothetical protein